MLVKDRLLRSTKTLEYRRSQRIPEARTTARRRKGMEKKAKGRPSAAARGGHQALSWGWIRRTNATACLSEGREPAKCHATKRVGRMEWWASTERTRRCAGRLPACYTKAARVSEGRCLVVMPVFSLTPTVNYSHGGHARKRLAMRHKPITGVIVVMLYLERQTRAGKGNKQTNKTAARRAKRRYHWLARAKR